MALVQSQTVVFLDTTDEMYRFTESPDRIISGLCFASLVELETTHPDRVMSTMNAAHSKLTEFKHKVQYMRHLMDVKPSAEVMGTDDDYDIVPPPALYKLIDNLKMTAEPLNFIDISMEDIESFDKTTLLATQLLEAYKILGRFMSFPLILPSGTELTLFHPEYTGTEDGSFVGPMKYYDGSNYTQYLMYPQGYVSPEGEIRKVSAQYLGVLDAIHPFTSSLAIDQYLCNTDISGTPTCDVPAPVDASPLCGNAVVEGKKWENCPTKIMTSPQFFLSSICDSEDTSVRLSAPFDINVYSSCPKQQPVSLGHYAIGIHSIQRIGSNDLQCNYAWSEDDGLDNLQLEPTFRGASLRQNAINTEGLIPRQRPAKDEGLEEWEIAVVSLTSLCTAGCAAFFFRYMFRCGKCTPSQRRARKQSQLLSKYIAERREQERTRPAHRTQAQFALDHQNEQVARQPPINPTFSPIVRNTVPTRPADSGRQIVPVSERLPRSSTPSTLFLVNEELMCWQPVDHRMSFADREQVKSLVAEKAPGIGVPFEKIPLSIRRFLS